MKTNQKIEQEIEEEHSLNQF